MRLRSVLVRCCRLAAVAACVAGCSQFGSQSDRGENDPDFVRGKSRLGAKDVTGAIDAFGKALCTDPANAAAHFELGLIFYEPKFDAIDYVASCYHLQKHLQFKPDSSHADIIPGYIKVCQKEISREIAMAPIPPSEIEAIRSLQQQNSQLRKQTKEQHSQIQSLKSRLTRMVSHDPRMAGDIAAQPGTGTASPGANSNPGARPPLGSLRNSGHVRSHEVKKGDTIYSLSRSYGVSEKTIRTLNPRINPLNLKVGQQIKIPPASRPSRPSSR